MGILKIDFRRAVLNNSLVISILLGIGCMFIGIFVEPIRSAVQIYYVKAPGFDIESKARLIGNSLNKVTLWNFGTYFYPLIMPLICCIPFTVSYLKDKKTGFSKFVIIRTSYKKYVFSKINSTFISGFLSVFLSTIIFVILISVIDSGEDFRSIYNDQAFLGNLYRSNFNLYVFIYSLIGGLFGGVYSIIGLAISSLIDNELIALVSPFVLYYLGIYFADVTGLIILNPSIVNNYGHFIIPIDYRLIFGQLISLFIISLVIFLYKTYWSDKYE